MKTTKTPLLTVLLAALSVAFVTGCACGGKCSSKSCSMGMQVKAHPLDTCLVCGMKLGKDDTTAFNYQGQEIKVCSAAEQAEFNKNPDKYMQKLADAAKQKTPGM